MKKYVSVNAKYYKHSNASGEMGHVDRLFAENVNSFPQYTKYNFGSDFDLFKKYQEIHQFREEVTGKKSRKDSNTFMDCVVAFSLDQWEFLEQKLGNDKLENYMKLMMNNFMEEMKKTHGLEPCGFKMHLDEGHEKQFKAFKNQQDRIKKGLLKDGEEIIDIGDLTRNIHAHVIFYNFDFERKIAPLRKMTKKTFENFQDIAANAFSKAGFVRGISKEITKKKHLEKDAHVERVLAEKDQQIDELNDEIQTLKDDQELYKEQNKILKTKIEKAKSENSELVNSNVELQNANDEMNDKILVNQGVFDENKALKEQNKELSDGIDGIAKHLESKGYRTILRDLCMKIPILKNYLSGRKNN